MLACLLQKCHDNCWLAANKIRGEKLKFIELALPTKPRNVMSSQVSQQQGDLLFQLFNAYNTLYSVDFFGFASKDDGGDHAYCHSSGDVLEKSSRPISSISITRQIDIKFQWRAKKE